MPSKHFFMPPLKFGELNPCFSTYFAISEFISSPSAFVLICEKIFAFDFHSAEFNFLIVHFSCAPFILSRIDGER